MNLELRELVKKIVSSGLASSDEIVGCTEEEIDLIQDRFRLKLPARYADFLKVMGKCAGWLLEGSDVFFPELLECRNAAESLLAEENSKFRLSKSRFVFLQHQGYQFLFFDTTCGDDPPVFKYLEGDDSPSKVADSFSDWLLSTVDASIDINDKIKDKRPPINA